MTPRVPAISSHEVGPVEVHHSGAVSQREVDDSERLSDVAH